MFFVSDAFTIQVPPIIGVSGIWPRGGGVYWRTVFTFEHGSPDQLTWQITPTVKKFAQIIKNSTIIAGFIWFAYIVWEEA